MKIRELALRSFAALPSLRLEFEDGVNVLAGPNEAGKSTVYRALTYVLFTPTSLRKKEFERLIAPILPVPHGDSAECEIVIEIPEAGSYRLRRRWGADALEELTYPNGQIIRGGTEIERAVRSLLPVSEGTMRRVLLAPQTALRETIPELRANPETTEELGEALRRSLFETGGVGIDRFRRLLEGRIEEYFARWDEERGAPEGGRGIEKPWKKNVGVILGTYYQAEGLERELNRAEAVEQELGTLGSRAASLESRLAQGRKFIESHEKTAKELRSAEAVRAELAAVEQELAVVHEHNSRWPVAESKRAELDETTARLDRRLAELRLERHEADKARVVSERSRKLAAVEERRRSAGAVAARLSKLTEVSDAQVEELSQLERSIARLEESFRVGDLTVTVEGPDSRVRYQVDLNPEAQADTSPDNPLTIEGHKAVVLKVGSYTVTSVAGAADPGEMHRQLDASRGQYQRLCKTLGVSSSAEAAERRAEYRGVERELASAKQEIQRALGEDDYETLRASVPEDDSGEAHRPVEEIASDVARVDEQIHSKRRDRKALEEELGTLTSRYGSKEELAVRLGDLSVRKRDLAADLTRMSKVPEGYESTQAFLAAYDSAEREIGRLREDLAEVRQAQARLEERLPEESSEELRIRLDDARRTYNRELRVGTALRRIQQRSERILSELDSGTMERYSNTLSRYLLAMTGGVYEAGLGDGVPAAFRRAEGMELSLELLSTGTRDTVALALRLAIAELILGDRTAPLVLDDPLVDLDPHRQTLAAAGIRDFGRQVLFFTCHPSQIELFPEANHIQMG